MDGYGRPWKAMGQGLSYLLISNNSTQLFLVKPLYKCYSQVVRKMCCCKFCCKLLFYVLVDLYYFMSHFDTWRCGVFFWPPKMVGFYHVLKDCWGSVRPGMTLLYYRMQVAQEVFHSDFTQNIDHVWPQKISNQYHLPESLLAPVFFQSMTWMFVLERPWSWLSILVQHGQETKIYRTYPRKRTT